MLCSTSGWGISGFRGLSSSTTVFIGLDGLVGQLISVVTERFPRQETLGEGLNKSSFNVYIVSVITFYELSRLFCYFPIALCESMKWSCYISSTY